MRYPVLLACLCAWLVTAAGVAYSQDAQAVDAPADAAPLIADEVWERASAPMSLHGGVLSGPGADRLREAADGATYVLFGEQHFVEGIAQIVEAFYREQLEAEPDSWRLALEQGPWITHRICVIGVDAAIRENPFSIAFDSDGDLDLMRVAMEANGPTGEAGVDAEYSILFQGSDYPVWGLDQESTAIHPLQRLTRLELGWWPTRHARGLLLKAALRGGEYIRQPHFADISALEEQMEERYEKWGSSEVNHCIVEIRESTEIFVAHRAAQRGEKPFAESVDARESLMKRRFDEYDYTGSRAHNRLTSLPRVRVLFKMGGAHVVRGIGPNGVETLGEHVAQAAEARGERSLHVGIRAWSEVRDNQPPGSAFGDGDVVFVDTATIRDSLSIDQFAALSDEARMDFEGFDALIVLRNTQPASRAEIAVHKRAFRQRLIRTLAVGLVPPLLLLATALWPLAAWSWRVVRRRPRAENAGARWPWIPVALSALLLLGLTAAQFASLMSKGLENLSTLAEPWITLRIATLAVSLLMTTTALGFVHARRMMPVVARVQISLVAAGVVLLAIFMDYWAIGSMLG